MLSGDSIFILQSLTASKMRKSPTKKLHQLHKAKTCWTENWWSRGIMSNFWGQLFYVLGANFFFLIIQFKLELSPQNIHSKPLICLHLGKYKDNLNRNFRGFCLTRCMIISICQAILSIYVLLSTTSNKVNSNMGQVVIIQAHMTMGQLDI